MNSDLERLIGRAVLDREFREQVLNDAEGAAKAAGFNLSDVELEQLKAHVERYKTSVDSGTLDALDKNVSYW